MPPDEIRASEYVDALVDRWQRQSPHAREVTDRGRLLSEEANDLPAASVRLCVKGAEEFEIFGPLRYSPLAEVPDLPYRYLARMSQRGQRPLTFVPIPRVLVAGPIDVRGCRVVRWEDPPEG